MCDAGLVPDVREVANACSGGVCQALSVQHGRVFCLGLLQGQAEPFL